MSFLQKYLDEYDLNFLYTIYNEEIISSLEEKNFLKIVRYLIENDINIIEEIIVSYLKLFLIEYDDFVQKFEFLKIKYGGNISNKISYDVQILEEIIC